jgi:hypothetical protein
MPIPGIIPWANELNYPAGGNAWNGQPCKVAPVGDVFTPNTKPPAEEFNFVLNRIEGEVLSLAKQISAQGALNWYPTSVLTGLACDVIGWDEFGNRWLVVMINTGTNVVTMYHASGVDTISLGGVGTGNALVDIDWVPQASTPALTLTSTSVLTGVSSDPDGHHFYTARIDSNTHTYTVYVIDATAGTPQWQTVEGATSTWDDLQMVVSGSFLVYALGATTAADSRLHVFATPAPVGGAGLANIPISTISGIPGTPTVNFWAMKQNGAYALAVPLTSQPTPFVLKGSGTLTSAGSWAASTAIGSVVNSSDDITGVDWGADAAGPCWIMTVVRGGTTTRLLRSADGINWTLVTTLTSVAFVHMCYAGGIFFAATDHAPPVDVYFTQDGGTTWYRTQCRLPHDSGPPVVGMNGSPTQAAVWAGASFRFSGCSGTPATVVT